ncbi:nmra-like family protein [Metabacillus indicus]|uniref:Nmra-like family protein n=1 Tax=Metabacillus indicus TaxID=246786 RepID=A0A084H2E2_METID|nr:nmra-like family protein [Metabacillus indicus]
MKILVTGSTGQLGKTITNHLKDSEYEVKLTSRRKPEDMSYEWVYSDLLTGDGLEEAVRDVDVIIHAATSPVKNSELIEVSGLERLLSRAQNIQHFIYPSIVGIDQIPYKYYKLKYKAEALLENSSVPHTIVRATQFHGFVEKLFLSKPLFKRYVIPGSIKFQSVDVKEFAKHLLELSKEEPQGRTDDFGGPDIVTLSEMAEMKIKINNEKNKVMNVSLPGKLYKSFLEGENTNSSQKTGKTTFEEYLRNN